MFVSLARRVAQPPAQLDDGAAQTRCAPHGDHEPFEPHRLVGEDGPAEPEPEIQAEHRGAAREVGSGQAHEQPGRLRAAGDRPREARARRVRGIVMDGVEVAGAPRVVGDVVGTQRDLGAEAVVRADTHHAGPLKP